MNERIIQVLQDHPENRILPFFWQHGESEEKLREYMQVIDQCHIGAVCVESRPHPDFAGEKWWRDMDVILDEARKRNMKVWILDDSHFPTGYANGAVESAPWKLRRRNLCYQGIKVHGKKTTVDVSKFLARKEKKEGIFDKLTGSGKKKTKAAPPDRLLSVTAFRLDQWQRPIDLTEKVQNGKITFSPGKGRWMIGLCKLSYRSGMHENYINMMNPDSVRILIDTVYEPHYQKYKEDFGSTIAGFFSDEPELGNGPLYKYGKNLGTPMEQPWSETLVPLLEESLGTGWKNFLPLIWENEADPDQTAKVRYAFMDVVTRKVQQAFSMQIGDWCRAHGVRYIGHVIEDNNQHCRTGSSLGHYFRGLSGQDMAGIDDIGGQVNPGQEDGPDRYFLFMPRDGEFFHYALGKLGSSLAAVDPLKQGNAMCEIFGNYGWSEGFRLEKYLADHFMVRGINHFVPHAFNPNPFPDVDCPPHFYADGHDPEYRHFSALMDYMNRVCHLISGGRHLPQAAVLYHGEAEWTGNCMPLQKPARILADRQIDFDIIPVDVFQDRERYRTDLTEAFRVNTQEYKMLIVPYAEYISNVLVQAVRELDRLGIPVWFIDAMPTGLYDGKGEIPVLENVKCTALETLSKELDAAGMYEVKLSPSSDRIRFLHYENGYHMYYFVNEGDRDYHGRIVIPRTGKCAVYRAEFHRLERAEISCRNGSTILEASIPTRQSLILLFDEFAEEELLIPFRTLAAQGRELAVNGPWIRSICKSMEYPNFTEAKQVRLPDIVSKEKPKFSGMIRYENTFTVTKPGVRMLLEITDAYEGVQVFVNGKSAGIQVVPVYYFELTELLKTGENQLVIEVSTTLERERRAGKESPLELLQRRKVMQPTGITGIVKLIQYA